MARVFHIDCEYCGKRFYKKKDLKAHLLECDKHPIVQQYRQDLERWEQEMTSHIEDPEEKFRHLHILVNYFDTPTPRIDYHQLYNKKR